MSAFRIKNSTKNQRSVNGVAQYDNELQHAVSHPTLDFFSSDSASFPTNPVQLYSSSSAHSSQRNSVHFSDEVSSPAYSSLRRPHKKDEHMYLSLPRQPKGVARSVPTMDALDDILMNQSIQQISLPEQVDNDDAESNSSTCKPSDYHDCESNPINTTPLDEKFSKAVSELSAVLQNLQSHASAVDNRLNNLEQKDSQVIDIQKRFYKFQSDVDSLSANFNVILQEFTRFSNEAQESKKETYNMQRQAESLILQAEQSKVAFEMSKRRYDELVLELYDVLNQLKQSFLYSEAQTNVCHTVHKKPDKNNKNPSKDSKKTLNKESSKPSVYHQIFQRPTNLLQGLASKQNIFAYGDKKSKSDKNEKKKKLDEKRSVNEERAKKRPQMTKSKSVELPKKISNKNSSFSKKSTSVDIKSIASVNELEDIPMMDDNSPIEHCGSIKGISYISINVKPPGSLSPKQIINRPNFLNFDLNAINCQDSPDSPIEMLPSEEFLQRSPKISNRDICQMSQPNLAAIMPLPTQQYLISSSSPKLGKYPVTRQASSPNLPRHNSSGFPLLRQNSLGTVPEESMIRQPSLISVPEQRPIVDQTLPISPSNSITSFSLSPSSSRVNINNRNSKRMSMEFSSNQIISSSSEMENNERELPSASEFFKDLNTAMTSSIKKNLSEKRRSRISANI